MYARYDHLLALAQYALNRIGPYDLSIHEDAGVLPPLDRKASTIIKKKTLLYDVWRFLF